MQPARPPLPPTTSTTTTSAVDEFDRWIMPNDFYANTSTIDEYKTYISESVTPVKNLISWWRDHRAIYSKLS